MAATLTNGGTAAMPEFLSRRDRPNGPWNLTAGTAQRGDAWTMLRDRKMRIPTGSDTVSRVIRAHEMMHAKVSPEDWSVVTRFGVTPDTAKAAEEFRVNMLIDIAGFAADELCDGSEELSGRRLAESGDWNGIVIFTAATAGFRACKDFHKGIAKVNPELAKAAREVEKQIMKHWFRVVGRQRAITEQMRKQAAAMIGRTSVDPEHPDLPVGLTSFTIPIAKMLEGLLRHPDSEDTSSGDEMADKADEMDVDKVREIANADGARFAPVVVDESVELSRRVDGHLGRKRVATNMGRHPRRIGRMLTDPQRRVFDHTVRGLGGLVIIDQSGSMHLSTDDVWKIVNAAPGCMIVGYSHATRNERVAAADPTAGNVWVLANRGRVCAQVRKGNGGNGVDAPAIRWALRHRVRNENVIWVSDGNVRGSRDEFAPHLADECAELVVRHGIHMVPNVDAAVEAFAQVAQGRRLLARAEGYVKASPKWRRRDA